MGRFLSIVVGAISIACVLPASALAVDQVIEAENMSWPSGSGEVYSPSAPRYHDGSTSGYYLWTRQPGTVTVTTTKPLRALRLRVRGEQKPTGLLACQGNPHVVVKDGSTTLISADVAPDPAVYRIPTIDIGAPLSSTTVPAGQHTFSIQLTNDQDSTTVPCDRNLWVDKLTLTTSQLFPDNSWRNTPLPDSLPPSDPAPVAALASQASVTSFGTSVNSSDRYSVPVYVVPAGQAPVSVLLDSAPHDPKPKYTGNDVTAFNSTFSQVPIPSNARASYPVDGTDDGDTLAQAQGAEKVPWSDREIAIYQPSTDTVWELYHLVKWNGQWVAHDGGKITDVSQHMDYTEPVLPSGKKPGVAATRIPLLATLQLADEVLVDGVIRHPITIHLPHVFGNYPLTAAPFVAPALGSDGDFQTADAVKEGTRFRLPRSVNVDGLGLSTYGRIFAHAAQDYGLIVTDKDCTNDALKTPPAVPDCDPSKNPANHPVITILEDPFVHSTDYSPVLGDKPWRALLGFPWDQLVVVDPSVQ